MQRIHDGASNTILFVEVNADQAVEWTRPQDLQYDPANPVAGLDRVAKPGFPAVFVDNAGYQVPANLDPQNVDRMMTINGGGFVDFSGFAPYLDSDRALNSIATAHLNYESAFQRFAKQAITHPNTGEALLSWRVALLPFLEQQWLYDQFQLDEPWNSPHNIQLLPMIPRVYANPAVAESMTNMLVFQGEDTVFPLDLTDRGRKLSDIEDNASETILTIQSDASCAAEWTRPVDILFDFSNPTICNEAAGTNVVMVDGSRRRLDEDIDETTMRELIVINDDDDAVPPLRDYEWRSFD